MKSARHVLARAAIAATCVMAVIAATPAASSIAAGEDGQSPTAVARISVDELKALMQKKQVIVVDVRDPQSFAAGHIPGAVNVPFDFIPDYVEAWKTDKRLIVAYCA